MAENTNFQLMLCKRSNLEYQKIRDKHYVKNHGCMGRQCHYLIMDNDTQKVIGIISGASAVWAVKARDDFFRINKDNRVEIVGKTLVDNVVFRLERQEKNLGTRILKVWRNQISKDWKEKYGDNVLGFETFIFGENRTGAMYKADNWAFAGYTAGSAKVSHKGMYNTDGKEREKVEKKLCFCKWNNKYVKNCLVK